ncbi:MAG TPA: hypothetical protein VFA74_16475 [Terriglobales bacterium]|nr:hypothetical protein [Terriglobales bacterium]
MKVWMLTQFHVHPQFPDAHPKWPVAASYGNGHVAPRHPDTEDGWALVLCEAGVHHIEAAALDPRVEPYRTLWDEITPQTVTAYADKGAKAGMMLCQLLSLLANTYDSGFGQQQ